MVSNAFFEKINPLKILTGKPLAISVSLDKKKRFADDLTEETQA
jgi:hypothetical protein